MRRGVDVGRVGIGGGCPISVQSMTNTDTRDAAATIRQIKDLAAAGADLIRVSVYDDECVTVARDIVDGSPVPLIADVHFKADLAVAAMERGFAKLRINPGNIGGAAAIQRVADCAKAHGAPIRVGVNAGSLDKSLLARHGRPTPEALAQSALDSARTLERAGFDQIVIAVKSSGVIDTIEAYRLIAKRCDYPLHLGVTEAGLPDDGVIKSSIAMGTLLAEGIGDTIRVSLSGDPLLEVAAGAGILRALGLRGGVDIIACPTCGRACLDVAVMARRVKDILSSPSYAGLGDHKPDGLFKVAVMGCVVNGPGEAREADIGIAGAPGGAALFVRDEPPSPIHGDPVDALIFAINRRWM